MTWKVTERERSPIPARAEAVTAAGMECRAGEDGGWVVWTRLNGVRIMASGRVEGGWFRRGAQVWAEAQAAALQAAAILEAAGAQGGF